MYKYKDKHYDVMTSEIEMKHPETGEWLPGVIYTQEENGKTYVREAKDFYNKFKEIEEESVRGNLI